MKLICLNKDKSVSRVKFHKINFDTTKYVMIPVGLDTTAFIILKSNDAMRNFHHAKIIMNAEVGNVSYEEFGNADYEERIFNNTSPLYGELETDNFIEYIQYLHSLNRMQYINNLANNTDTAYYNYLHIPYFSIVVYDNDNHIIFEKSINESVGSSIYPKDILKEIKKIYKPIELLNPGGEWSNVIPGQDRDVIFIKNDKWSIINKPEKNGLTGIWFEETSSYGFFYSNLLLKIPSRNWLIGCLQVNTNTVKVNYPVYDFVTNPGMISDELLDGTEGIYYHDIWTCELSQVIEYFVYIRYIWSITQYMGELVSYGKITNTIKSVAVLIVDHYHDDDVDYPSDTSYHKEFNINDIPSIENILDLSFGIIEPINV